MEQETISDRTSVRKKEEKWHSPHQRLWWTEFVQGLIALAFGLLLLAARSLAPRLFMYSLGVYLVIDGILELYDVHRRKGISQKRTLDVVGGVMSFLTGLLSLVFPAMSLLLLAGILAVRLFIRSVPRRCAKSLW